ncbi:MAG TPA: DnaJ domain-containing protein [Thermoanaerobaculia bacterium]|nr:DnaJ domain-containing protein [Thermoanaerobaculia bacterium]
MTRRSVTYIRACRTLGVAATTPVEEIARVYRALVKELHPDTHPDDPAAAARIAEVNAAWARIKYDVQRRQARFALWRRDREPTLTACAWPHPTIVPSCTFAGCELRPTEGGRCYRVMRAGVQLLVLHRHPHDPRLLFARDARGRVVHVNGVAWWTDVGGTIQPLVEE